MCVCVCVCVLLLLLSWQRVWEEQHTSDFDRINSTHTHLSLDDSNLDMSGLVRQRGQALTMQAAATAAALVDTARTQAPDRGDKIKGAKIEFERNAALPGPTVNQWPLSRPGSVT